MCKKCLKCKFPMRVEDGVHTCDNCLSEIVRIKREQWEAESGIKNESECEEVYRRSDCGAGEEEDLLDWAGVVRDC